MSSRTRIVLSIAVLFAFATAVSTIALRQVLLARVDARIEAALAQEVAELQRLAGQLRTTDARTLFDQFLSRDVPDEAEAAFTFLGEQPYRSNADLGTSQQLIDAVRDLGDVDEPERGDLDVGYRYVAVPVNVRGVRRGAFVVTADLEHERAEVADAVRVAGGIGFGMVVFVSVLAFAAVGRILAPLSTLGGTARSIESGDDLTRRIEVRGDDEHRRARATCSTRCSTGSSRRSRSSASSSPTRGTSCARRSRSSAATCSCSTATRETYRIVSDELDRMSRFVEDLLTLAQVRAPRLPHAVGTRPRPADGGADGEGEAARAARLAAGARPAPGCCAADRQRLTQAVMNLAAQRRPAHRGGRRDHARLLAARRLAGADLGRGRRAGHARGRPERIFERFAGEGTGLGLAIVRTIAIAHGGRVELESKPAAPSSRSCCRRR